MERIATENPRSWPWQGFSHRILRVRPSRRLADPGSSLRTLTTLDRFGVVQWLGDRLTLRMLQVPELKRGMGLPDRFRLDHGTRRDKVKLLGNGVCAPVMRKVVSTLLRGELKAVAAE